MYRDLLFLGYDAVIEKVRNRNFTPSGLSELLFARKEVALPPFESEMAEDEDDSIYYCYYCKYTLFNSRRSCTYCKGFDLCEPCFAIHGKKHSHKLKKHRKMLVQSLMDLVESIRLVLNEHEHDKNSKSRKNKRKEPEPPSQAPPPPKEIKGDINPPLQSEQNYDDEVIDCVCGNNKDLGFMISCEKCLAWLHGKCVGISKKNEPEIFYCPRCVAKPPAAKLSPKVFSPEKLKEYNLEP